MDVPQLKRCLVEGRPQVRLREILAAVESWLESLIAEEERAGVPAAGERVDEATDALIDAEQRVHDTPARTLAGLLAKAPVEVAVAERADLDKVALGFLREVAAFGAPAEQRPSMADAA